MGQKLMDAIQKINRIMVLFLLRKERLFESREELQRLPIKATGLRSQKLQILKLVDKIKKIQILSIYPVCHNMMVRSFHPLPWVPMIKSKTNLKMKRALIQQSHRPEGSWSLSPNFQCHLNILINHNKPKNLLNSNLKLKNLLRKNS